MKIGSLFSGAGGLDMAVEAVFGGEVIWQSEVDKAASTVLAHRFPGVPNLGDITKGNLNRFDPVDVICGGFPCQDVSVSGKRAGIKDGTRSGLWSFFADLIDHLKPPFVVIENVRGLLSANAYRSLEFDNATLGDGEPRPILRAAGAILGNLTDLGYDAQWTTIAASDVGAPHRRERVFIVAANSSSNRPSECDISIFPGIQPSARRNCKDARSNLLPSPRNTDGQRGPSREVGGNRPSGQKRQLDLNTITARAIDWRNYEPAIRRWEALTRPAPAPTEPNKNGNPRLSAAFSEWLMGWRAGWVTDPDIGISRNDQLRIIGNGVCPQQAIAALTWLLQVAEVAA